MKTKPSIPPFTPGPWQWESRSSTSDGYKDCALLGRDGDGVVYHSAVWQVSNDDARLIAAAPDLFAACKTFIDADPGYGYSPDEERARGLMRAAIARVEGR